MNGRVEICGINTSTLPKLSHKETIALIERAQSGDEQAKDEFLTANLRLVLSIIRRFYGKKESVDDIFQVGCIGLIKAMKNFDTSLNLRFSTYAVPMICGEVRRFLRDSSSIRVSRSIRDNAYKILRARQELEAANNAEASLEEVAAALNMPLADAAYAMDAISNPVSLFDPVYHDGGETAMIMDQISDEKNCDENWITGVSISEAMGKLSEREKQILLLRFYEGKTQIEVSSEIGISQAQVSRLEKNAVSTLKKNID
ncbi:MAG: RNA polymerase sporulation sigma factor SigG [Clostridiales bacterium]|jgi:RNA polymerase sporulation-specific sigma factor|nr:RNA polymerase sporulation sigma factor SigG [Clostridiales bacterium]